MGNGLLRCPSDSPVSCGSDTPCRCGVQLLRSRRHQTSWSQPLCRLPNLDEVPTKVVNPNANALLEPEVATDDDVDSGDDDDDEYDGEDDGC